MKIIVGLGNPDGIYRNTYHNIGFNAVDFFAKSKDLKFATTKAQQAFCKKMRGGFHKLPAYKSKIKYLFTHYKERIFKDSYTPANIFL